MTSSSSQLTEDLLAIELMRAHDGPEPRYDPEIDLELYQSPSLTGHVNEGRDGEVLRTTETMARRAGLMLDRRIGLGSRWPHLVRETVGWIQVGLVVLAILMALGATAPTLQPRDDQVVPILYYLAVFAIQIVFMLPPLLMTVAAILSGPGSSQADDRPNLASRILQRLGAATTLSTVVLRAVMRWIQPWLLRLRGRDRALEPDQADRLRQTLDRLRESRTRHTRILSLGMATISHLCGVAFSITLLATAWLLMSFQQLDYRLGTSTIPLDDLAGLVRGASNSVAWLVEPPSDADIAWLTGASLVEVRSDDPEAQARLEADIRTEWSGRLLALPLVFVLLPRLILLLLSRLMLGRALKQMRPDPQRDDYARLIMGYLTRPPVHGLSHIHDDAIAALTEVEPNDPRVEPVLAVQTISPPTITPPSTTPTGTDHAPPTPSDRVIVSNPTPSPAPTITATPLAPARTKRVPTATLSFWYETQPPDQVEAFLKSAGRRQITDAWFSRGEIDGRRARRALLDWLEAQREPIAQILMIVDLNRTPDDQLRTFLSRLHEAAATHAHFRAILTGGESLRQRYAHDPERIGQRITLWRSTLGETGFADRGVREHDFQTETEASRSRLAAWLSGNPEPQDSQDVPGTNSEASVDRAERFRAGLFPEAIPKILEPLGEFEAGHVEPFIAAERIQQQLTQLYRDGDGKAADRSRLGTWLKPSNETLDQLTARWDAVREALPQTDGWDVDSARHWVGQVARLERLTRLLPTKWTGIGGLCGAVLGTSGAIALGAAAPAVALPAVWAAALNAGVVGGGLGAAMGQWLPGRMKSRNSTADPGTTVSPTETEADQAATPPDFDQVARSGLLWALILELQGNPEQTIAEGLREILGEPGPPLTTTDQVADHLRQIEDRLTIWSQDSDPLRSATVFLEEGAPDDLR